MRYRFGFFWGLVLAIGGATTDSVAQTFDEALAATYMGNPALAAQRAALRSTDEEVPQALANWRPTVSLSGDYGKSAVRNHTASGTSRGQHRDPGSVGLSVDQPLYRGGRTTAATKKAFNNVQAARSRLISTEQSVLQDAVTAFMNVVRDQAVLELNINNEQVLRRQLEATQDRFRVGEVTRTDVHQAEARLSGATAERIQAEGNLEVSRAEYKNVVGEFPGTLSGPAVPSDIPANLDAALSEAIANNPDVLAASFDERASADNAEEVRGELLPSVSLSGSAQRAFDGSGENTRITTYVASVAVSVPLYQSGSVYSRLRSARQNIAENRQIIEDSRRSAIETATRAWETMQAARAAIQAFETQVTANEVALDGVQREAAVGSRTVLDVLDAEQELLDSRVSLVRERRNLIVAVYELKSAIGALTAQKLNLPVDYYDPDRHYREVRGKWFGGTSAGDGGTAQ
jgi:outer membrane protein